ncbi:MULTISPECIES: TetR/AcrR family transcriptional regulator C-terminal domain-containing protein [unclassified Variovorax]|uniref:TetR/AcrR family transcriptional regulator C-terminal domain-containing protein n=1 Tax=unclassified Variovorax TaxID=663243 RepID=UPI00076BC6D3|nr:MULTISPECIES: TetR/AcrR family transcriptional regulator C-terminal domain-containing protein [unclassified Variovorax]KWT94128.1 hypothetical protein APY03_2724 [Variovorax sp. WDL1]
MQAVLATTRISSQDIVDEFGSTRGLFIALVECVSAWMLEPLDHGAADASFQEKLHAFAHRVTDEQSASQLRCLYRIALTELIRNNGIDREFHQHGPGHVTDGLARFFRASQEEGIALEEDSRQLASHLMALLRAHLDLFDALPAGSSDGHSRRRGNVTRTIELFCAGIQMEANDADAVV